MSVADVAYGMNSLPLCLTLILVNGTAATVSIGITYVTSRRKYPLMPHACLGGLFHSHNFHWQRIYRRLAEGYLHLPFVALGHPGELGYIPQSLMAQNGPGPQLIPDEHARSVAGVLASIAASSASRFSLHSPLSSLLDAYPCSTRKQPPNFT